MRDFVLRPGPVMLQAISRLSAKKIVAKIAVRRESTLAWPRTENSASAAFAALKQDDDDHRGRYADVDDQQHQPPIVQKASYRVHYCPELDGDVRQAGASSRFRRPWR